MMEILNAENVALGICSYEEGYSAPTMAHKEMYVLTRDEDYQPKTDVNVCNDYIELVERFKDSGYGTK